MPDAILTALWRATWQAGVLCVLVLVLRWTLRDRLPPAWRCRLWGLVFLRLLLPAVPASPLSLFNVVPADPLPAVRWPTLVIHLQTGATPPPAESADPSPPPRAAFPWSDVLLWTWAGGAALLLGATAAAHAGFARRVARGRLTTPPAVAERWAAAAAGRAVPQVVVTDAVASPALFGGLRGRLLLPPDLWARLSPAELDLVFRHELAHVRRHDLAAGWAAVRPR